MFRDTLVLGGAGLVGLQVCRRIATEFASTATRIVVASLLESEARDAATRLQAEFPKISFLPEWGNLFVPDDLANLPRNRVLADPALRRRLLDFLYGDFEAACTNNHLAKMVLRHRPEVVVDCVNTATGLSYQDVFQGAAKVREWLSADPASPGFDARGVPDLEAFLLSQSVPQLVRHVQIVHRVTTEARTRVYIKVGTTGTGGMGMNIPYTHSEDKPSRVLLAKTEAAFGHTGLLFLLARTPDAPIVKEVKPAAMIGYKGVRTMPVRDKHDSDALFVAREAPVSGSLELREDAKAYETDGSLVLSVVDTGENGVFTRGEFAAITALGQMQYVTPEEIARVVVHEIRGQNTGQDVISAIDSSVMDPSYKAGLVRQAAMADLEDAERSSGMPSIALGRLGPPELSKLLFEAQLLKEAFGTLAGVLAPDGQPRPPEEVAQRLTEQLGRSAVRLQAPSIGIPILSSDGRSLLRGPRINVPEPVGTRTTVSLDDPAAVDRWARKGWVDLRPANAAVWTSRFQAMIRARGHLRDMGSAAASLTSYLPTAFEIGEVVAWIFNNEMGGYRIK
jgi:hypothetical protein